MTTREKVAHLYRRFGFGASPQELDQGERLGVEGTIVYLIDYDKIDEAFPVSPWEFVWRRGEDADLGTWRLRLWWAMRMLCTRRPFQERLTLFWHNHFAVSDAKVEDGPMMVQYLDTLRAHAAGPFVDLLTAVAKDPAMMRYLDMGRSVRGRPNENFAREVMELFTLGIGNYTEKDVQEAARAFTGWGYVHIFWEMPGNNDAKVKDAIRYGRPFSGFAPVAAMHDPGPKTILGKTAAYDGDGVLQVLADHPATARHLCRKLWEHLAYADPEPAVVERLTKVFHRTNGDLREVAKAIAHAPEFWNDRCVRAQVKSPIDLCVAVGRQMGAGEALMELRGPTTSPETAIPQRVLDHLWGICDRAEKAGLSLFYPPDVSGWRWGRAWLSPAAMAERYRYRGMMIWGDKGAGVGSRNVLAFVKSRKPGDADGIAHALTELFDVPLPDAGREVITKMLDKRGGTKLLENPDGFAGALDQAMLLLMAAPETHLC